MRKVAGRLPRPSAGRWGGRRLLIFLAFALAYYFSNFFRSANAVISVDLVREFSLTASQLGLMTSLFYVVFALVQLPLGGALDRWGPRWVTSGLMLFAAAGSLVFSAGSGFGGLALGRALIGAGMAGVLMGTYTSFSRWFSPARFATAASLVVAVGALGALTTGTPLAWFDQTFGWRAVFLWGAAGVLVSASFMMVVVRRRPEGPARVHLPVLAEAPAVEPSVVEEPAVESSVVEETAVEEPAALKPRASYRDIFRDRRFRRIAALNFMTVGTFLSMQGLWSGPFLYDSLRLSRMAAGNLITLAAVGGLAGYLSCGWLADRLGAQRVAVFGGSVFVAAQFGLVITGLSGVHALAYPAYLAFGFGGAYNIILMAHVRQAFPEALIGRAVSAVNMFGIGGTALLQWSMGVLIGSYGKDAAGHYPAAAYATAFGITGLLGLATLLWYSRLVPTPGSPAPPGPREPS
jgi:MFS family permease